MTTETTEQIHIVNIVNLVQDKLQTNFKSIVKKFKAIDDLFKQYHVQTQNSEERIKTMIKQQEQSQITSVNNLANKLQNCYVLMSGISSRQIEHEIKIDQSSKSNQKLSNKMIGICTLFQERMNEGKVLQGEMNQKLINMQQDIFRAYQEILKKQDSTEVVKMFRQFQKTKEKMAKSQTEYKNLNFKLQKMELQNQKVEKNLTNKQFEILKDVEDKIRNELKNIQQVWPIPSRICGQKLLGFEANKSVGVSCIKQQKVLIQKCKGQKQQDGQLISNSMREVFSNMKLNDKIQQYEIRLKNIENSIRNLTDCKKLNYKPTSQEFIKEKINELKPELIKLWAKCDTLDDRISFNNEKLAEESKCLAKVMELHKQHNPNRMDEKFNNFKTQIYAIIKQFQSKIDSKVNLQDHQKHWATVQTRLGQLREIVFMKSDKIEVKKALIFLETKIKEIILVITEDEQNEKDALFTKKQLKCISCDKDIERINKLANLNGKQNWDSLPFRDNPVGSAGKTNMLGYGNISKKVQSCQSKQLPILKAKKNMTERVIKPLGFTSHDKSP